MEACGGDGVIAVGAYRGDETTETRECRLCGGVVTDSDSNLGIIIEPLSYSASGQGAI